MAMFLVYVFRKGSFGLRTLVLLCFAGLCLFAFLSTLNNLRSVTERPVPAHVSHPR